MKIDGLIDCIVGHEASSSLTSRIDIKVKEAIETRLWRKEYMTYKEQMDQEFNRGLEQGIRAFIEDKVRDNVDSEVIASRLKDSFGLDYKKSKEYIAKYDKRA